MDDQNSAHLPVSTRPWRVYTTDKGTYIGVGDADGAGILDFGFGVWGSEEEKKASADLIVAAVNRHLDASARQSRLPYIEIDDGVLVYREGSLSVTVCAETATVFDVESGRPAVKVPLSYGALDSALASVGAPVPLETTEAPVRHGSPVDSGTPRDTARLPVLVSDIVRWRRDWLEENDPRDGTDCVTPFDHYLYGTTARSPV